MARPTLARARVTRLGDNGIEIVGVEFMFGTPGASDHYRSTLWEDWATKAVPLQTAEMNRRYDEFMAMLEQAKNPAPPGREDLRAQLDAIDDQIIQLQRQRLDIIEQLNVVERAARTIEV